MRKIVLFRVKPVADYRAHVVEVECGRKSYSRYVDLDDLQDRESFLASVHEKHGGEAGDPINTLSRLNLAFDLAVEDMHLRHGVPILQPAVEVSPIDVEWLWPQTIPFGKLTLVVGAPGVGKTYFALDVAARVTQGDYWPDDPPGASMPRSADVLILSAEDDARDTLLPRLEAQSADLEHITLLNGVEKSDRAKRKQLRFSLVTMLDLLEQSIERSHCRLIIVDPISAYLRGSGASRNADAHELLAPLALLARRYKVAVLAIDHLNRDLAGPFIYRSLGSLEFAAAARAVWAIFRDPRDRERRLFVPVKSNLAYDAHALAFRLEPCETSRVPVLCWEAKRLALAELAAPLGNQTAASGTRRFPQRALAIEWLRRQLTSGQRGSTELFAAARIENISKITLRRAFYELGGAARRVPAGHWVWMLPAPQDDVSNMSNLIKLDGEAPKSTGFSGIPALHPPPSALRTDVSNMSKLNDEPV